MCDICGSILELLESYDSHANKKLTKKEVMSVIIYNQIWPQQRQCMCCYTDLKNFTKINHVIQKIIGYSIQLTNNLLWDDTTPQTEDDEVDVTGLEKKPESSSSSADVKELVQEEWSDDEKDRLFHFVGRVFLVNFPFYLAYKHRVSSGIEDLSKQETMMLAKYCEFTDPEAPVLLLKNVCYFMQKEGCQAILQCFQRASLSNLPATTANNLTTVISNLRMWLNSCQCSCYITPIRTHIIRYMLTFSEKELKMMVARNMTELVWQVLKESRDMTMSSPSFQGNNSDANDQKDHTNINKHIFDKDGLDLALKYFTCSMLTLRLAGLAQINNQINVYSEYIQGEPLIEDDQVGKQIADWLVINKIPEEIFGPNLHVEIIKQSQATLVFLAIECRLSIAHIDAIWAASQLKHCGKQVLDVLLIVVKSVEQKVAQHLHKLLQNLSPSSHSAQTLLLASALVKILWMNVTSTISNQPSLTIVTHQQGDKSQVYAITTHEGSVGFTEVPDELIKEACVMSNYPTHQLKQVNYSQSESEDDDEEEEEEEEEEDDKRHYCIHPLQKDLVVKKSHSGSFNNSSKRFWPYNKNIRVSKRIRKTGSWNFANESSSDEEDEEEVKDNRKLESDDNDGDDDDDDNDDNDERILQNKRLTKQKHLMSEKQGHSKLLMKNQKKKKMLVSKGDKVDIMREEAFGNRAKTKCEEEEEEEEEKEDGKEKVGGLWVAQDQLIDKEGLKLFSNDDDDDDDDDDDEEESDYLVLQHNLMQNNSDEDEEEEEEEEEEEIIPKRKIKKMKMDGEVMPSSSLLSSSSSSSSPSYISRGNLTGLSGIEVLKKVKESGSKSFFEGTEGGLDDNEGNVLTDAVNVGDYDDGLPAKEGVEVGGQVDMASDDKMGDDKDVKITSFCKDSVPEQDRRDSAKKDGGCMVEVLNKEEPSLNASSDNLSKHFDVFNDVKKKDDKGIKHTEEESILEKDNEEEEDEEVSSVTSRYTNKSDKNMSDFDGEVVPSDEEISYFNNKTALFKLRHPSSGNMQSLYQQYMHLNPSIEAINKAKARFVSSNQSANVSKVKKVSLGSAGMSKCLEVCHPKHNIIWQLLQDENIDKLMDGLAFEAEKILSALLCLSSDRVIRGNFIEAAVENIANNRCVVVSLRLLSKLLSSFNQYRAGPDAHVITMWANSSLNLMGHFFNNLMHFTNACRHKIKPASIFSAKEEIQARLHFLTCIFCSNGSPINFRLTKDQLETLWDCLVTESPWSDDCLQWLYNQLKNKESHAFKPEVLRGIFIEKLSSLKAEDTTVLGLSLFTQLYQLSNNNIDQVLGIDHLWQVALKARNTDVSLSCINILNNHYICFSNSTEALMKEKHFVEKCMKNLRDASKQLQESPNSSLLVMQRALLLLTNHLENFCKRHSYYLRMCLLYDKGVLSHYNAPSVGSSTRFSNSYKIRIGLQTAGSNNKTTIEMNSDETLAELRAEVAFWWQQTFNNTNNNNNNNNNNNSGGITNSGSLSKSTDTSSKDTPFIAACHIRMLTLGQELLQQFDEKTLAEMQFKDSQQVFVSMSLSRMNKTYENCVQQHNLLSSVDRLPMMLLSEDPHFSSLFALLHQLYTFNPGHYDKDLQEQLSLQTKSMVLSRKVWSLLMLLPTNKKMLASVNDVISVTTSSNANSQCVKGAVNTVFTSDKENAVFSVDNCGDKSTDMRLSCESNVDEDISKTPAIKKSLPADSNVLLKDEKSENDTKTAPQSSSSPPNKQWSEILNVVNPHRLMYTLQIIENLAVAPRHKGPLNKKRKQEGGQHLDENPMSGDHPFVSGQVLWTQKFIETGGFEYLMDIFTSQRLNHHVELTKNDWLNDCLACLLRLINIISIQQYHLQDNHCNFFDMMNNRKLKKKSLEGMIVQPIHKNILPLINVPLTLNIVFLTLYQTCLPHHYDKYPIIYVSHYQVIHYLLTFLVSMAFSTDIFSHLDLYDHSLSPKLINKNNRVNLPVWLRLLTLETTESVVRQESCQALYRLCMGHSTEGVNGYKHLIAIFNCLLLSFDEACCLKCTNNSATGSHNRASSSCYVNTPIFYPHKFFESKAPQGPGCRDYMWLLCQLLDAVKRTDAELSWKEGSVDSATTIHQLFEVFDLSKIGHQLVNLSSLCEVISHKINTRPFNEKRQSGCEDEGLIGLMRLCEGILKHNPPFKHYTKGQAFLHEVFQCLFALPSPSRLYLPKCNSHNSRLSAYDVLVELVKNNINNYITLHSLLMKQNHKDSHLPYSWDTWPNEEERSKCGFVGLTNLGATCYLATCMQHLFMLSEARKGILMAQVEPNSLSNEVRHYEVIKELQKMFAFLLVSERKAYNPQNFCKVYCMDHQPLNTTEQKDMTEFFTDLISKLEETSPRLKSLVKSLFGGVLTNNVVSLDCGHVSRIVEEFYTVRCQVADMKSLYESLDEVTVKDMLEGDNMYTCSKCLKKVRAEKRACFYKLPKILCFNTMRYTFNMLTMLKEKVNTHFSFPMKLDMSAYMEQNLIKVDEDSGEETEKGATSHEYELIGVTVHTGTADAGHYYSFIKDCSYRNNHTSDDSNSQDNNPNNINTDNANSTSNFTSSSNNNNTTPSASNNNNSFTGFNTALNSGADNDRWYLFNDAEIKPFDPAQLPNECFGGEMTSKTYDSVNDKFMDFSFEKTHSAYMLFYERIDQNKNNNDGVDGAGSENLVEMSADTDVNNKNSNVKNNNNNKDNNNDMQPSVEVNTAPNQAIKSGGDNSADNNNDNNNKNNNNNNDNNNNESMSTYGNENYEDSDANSCDIQLSLELSEWIWEDNMHFLQEKNIFDHNYFSFMWQVCNNVPGTLLKSGDDNDIYVPLMTTKLSASFILESLIHSKEKPTLLQWIENMTKSFNSDKKSCLWFLEAVTTDHWWVNQILIKCPNQTIRQMFQRLVIHVINQLKPICYKASGSMNGDDGGSNDKGKGSDFKEVANTCVNQFILKLLSVLEQPNKPHCRYLSEYFGLLLEFAKLRVDDCSFLNQNSAITTLVDYFMTHKHIDNMQEGREEEEDVEDMSVAREERYVSQAFERMVALVSVLVEKSRCEGRSDRRSLNLTDKDMHSLLGEKGLSFLYHQIKDSINLKQTCNLIFSLSKHNELLASNIIQMIFHSLARSGTETQPFFKLFSMLVEFNGGGGGQGISAFMQHILIKFWEVAEYCPQPALEWLASQVARNKTALSWVLQTLDAWVEVFLMAYNNVRVRNSAAYLLVALVPSNHFRQTFRTSRSMLSPHKDNFQMSEEATEVLHKVYNHLLKLLSKARQYIDLQSTSKLVPYFSVLNFFLVSKLEKLMFSKYFNDLWLLFQPKLSEPQVAVNHNKQALLIFWYNTCLDCPENIDLIVNNPIVSKNIAFNYILADHEDQDVVMINRSMLPAYYCILKMCCMQSRSFCLQLSQHQNIQWAFRNITTHPAQYTAAVEELYGLMRLMSNIDEGMKAEEKEVVLQFRRTTLQLYLHELDGRNHWQTLIAVFRILLERPEERLFAIQNGCLPLMHQSFSTMHLMRYEATACHISEDLVHLLNLIAQTLTTARKFMADRKVCDVKPHLTSWKERGEFVKRLLSLLNFYTNQDLRQTTFACLREMVLTYQFECIQTIVPILTHAHHSFHHSNQMLQHGPFFPKSGHKLPSSNARISIRCPRPQFQMMIRTNQIELKKGEDPTYDSLCYEAFNPYHHLIDLLVRVAVNQQNLPSALVKLSVMVANESVRLHLPYFAKLWLDVYKADCINRKWVDVMLSCDLLVTYFKALLWHERMALCNGHIYQFCAQFLPMISDKVFSQSDDDDDDVGILAVVMSSLQTTFCLLKQALQQPSQPHVSQLLASIDADLRVLHLVVACLRKACVNIGTTIHNIKLFFSSLMQHSEKPVENPADDGAGTSAGANDGGDDSEKKDKISSKSNDKKSDNEGKEKLKSDKVAIEGVPCDDKLKEVLEDGNKQISEDEDEEEEDGEVSCESVMKKNVVVYDSICSSLSKILKKLGEEEEDEEDVDHSGGEEDSCKMDDGDVYVGSDKVMEGKEEEEEEDGGLQGSVKLATSSQTDNNNDGKNSNKNNNNKDIKKNKSTDNNEDRISINDNNASNSNVERAKNDGTV